MFELELGMEPMAGGLCGNGEDPDYFTHYIFVQPGQAVTKGQVIGQMVLAPGSKAHIHFNAKYHKYPDRFMCPDIFSSALTDKIDGKYMGICNSEQLRDVAQGTLCYKPGPGETHQDY